MLLTIIAAYHFTKADLVAETIALIILVIFILHSFLFLPRCTGAHAIVALFFQLLVVRWLGTRSNTHLELCLLVLYGCLY